MVAYHRQSEWAREDRISDPKAEGRSGPNSEGPLATGQLTLGLLRWQWNVRRSRHCTWAQVHSGGQQPGSIVGHGGAFRGDRSGLEELDTGDATRRTGTKEAVRMTIKNPDVRILAGISQALQAEY